MGAPQFKHILRIEDTKANMESGSALHLLKPKQMAIQTDGATSRLSFRNSAGSYIEVANLTDGVTGFGVTGPQGDTGIGFTGFQGVTGVPGITGNPGSLIKSICFSVYDSDEFVAIGDGVTYFSVPQEINGLNLVDAVAVVDTQGVTNSTTIQVRRKRGASNADMLSSPITLAAVYFANNGSINLSNDDVALGDQVFVDIDTIHTGTAPKGLSVTLSFQ